MRPALVLTALLISATLAASVRCLAGSGLDELEFEPATVDLGRMAPQTLTAREVVVRNRSASPLTILGIQADCGCTTSEVEDSELAPGESTVLVLSFDSRNYSGAIRRQVQVNTTLGTKVLPVHVTVAPYADWDIAPSPAMLSPSLVGEPARGAVSLARHGNRAVSLTGASTNHPWLEATLSGADESGTYTVALRKSPDAPAGTHPATLTIQTDDPATPTLEVKVIVPVVSAVRVAPNPIVVSAAALEQEGSASFRVIGWPDKTPPAVRSSRGEIRYLGAANGEHTFELLWKARTAGSEVATVQLHRGERLELEVPAILRAPQ
jgi:mRNA-degrading endonuclease toxin of MazEF toxin-antitoxin module